MIFAAAIVVVVSCVAASAWRLRIVLAPTGVDVESLQRALSRSRPDSALAILERAVAQGREAEWERGLVASLRATSRGREAHINEQLTELDHLLTRWARVPRVCASICTSSGFLLAAAALRTSLASAPETGPGSVVDEAVIQAINIGAIGLAGAAFCIAIQMRARQAAAATAAGFDRLVERLERGTSPAPDAATPTPSENVSR